MTEGEEFILVGRVLSPWGKEGGFKVEVLTDFPQRFTADQKVYIGGQAFTIEWSRRHQESLIIKLGTIDGIEKAKQYRDSYLEIPGSELHPLPEGEYYRFQLMGLEVWAESGEHLGKVTEIISTGGNDVLVVDGKLGQLLIPAIDDVIKGVDLQKKCIIIELMAGIVETPNAKPGKG